MPCRILWRPLGRWGLLWLAGVWRLLSSRLVARRGTLSPSAGLIGRLLGLVVLSGLAGLSGLLGRLRGLLSMGRPLGPRRTLGPGRLLRL